MKELEERDTEEGIEDGIKLPSMEVARSFAVETIDFPSPLGLQLVFLICKMFSHEHADTAQSANEVYPCSHAELGRVLPRVQVGDYGPYKRMIEW